MIYLDTSALVKLVWIEENSVALGAYLRNSAGELPATSSVLVTVETRRAVQRISPAHLAQADRVLSRVDQIALTPGVIESASRLPDPALRSLDALHVATALLVSVELSAFVTYDRRLLAAARAHGLPAVAPA